MIVLAGLTDAAIDQMKKGGATGRDSNPPTTTHTKRQAPFETWAQAHNPFGTENLIAP